MHLHQEWDQYPAAFLEALSTPAGGGIGGRGFARRAYYKGTRAGQGEPPWRRPPQTPAAQPVPGARQPHERSRRQRVHARARPACRRAAAAAGRARSLRSLAHPGDSHPCPQRSRGPSTTSAAFLPSCTPSSTRRPGAPEKAHLVRGLLPEAILDDTWGLDHASWAMLRHMWPSADVPVFELSLDVTVPPETHWELGRRLAPLRDQGVLVVGSGNIVHSFAGVDWEPGAAPHPWAVEFDAWVADALVRADGEALVALRDRRSCGPAVGAHERPLPATLYPAAMATPSRRGHLPVRRDRDGLHVHALCEVRLRAPPWAPHPCAPPAP